MMQTEVALRIGASGFLVRDLQEALGVAVDGRYGPATEGAVRQARHTAGLTPGNFACEALHRAVGIPWPSLYLRCLNITSVLEGTSFGDFNPTDIDGAGLTYGCAGFTTAHGEVQEILRRFVRCAPGETASESFADLRKQLTDDDPAAWRRLVFGSDKRVRPALGTALTKWGSHSIMRQVQVDAAREWFWVPSQAAALRLGLRSQAGCALMFDVAVQNGGWSDRHERHLGTWPDTLPECPNRLDAIARAVAACARPRWRADVLQRKLLFARSCGRVHGITMSLRSFGLA